MLLTNRWQLIAGNLSAVGTRLIANNRPYRPQWAEGCIASMKQHYGAQRSSAAETGVSGAAWCARSNVTQSCRL